jgi:hypothetical protein
VLQSSNVSCNFLLTESRKRANILASQIGLQEGTRGDPGFRDINICSCFVEDID